MYNFVLAVHLPAGIYTLIAMNYEFYVYSLMSALLSLIRHDLHHWPWSILMKKYGQRKHGYSAIKWRKKYHSVETVLKYHSVETVLKYNRKW